MVIKELMPDTVILIQVGVLYAVFNTKHMTFNHDKKENFLVPFFQQPNNVVRYFTDVVSFKNCYLLSFAHSNSNHLL